VAIYPAGCSTIPDVMCCTRIDALAGLRLGLGDIDDQYR
jgi:hypothetical protein